MRTLAALLAVLAATGSTAVAAGAGKPTSLSLVAGSYRVLYGHATTISGRLHGGGIANRLVVVTARRYRSSAPVRIATLRTSSDGSWGIRVEPVIRTTYEARAGRLTSRRIAIGVAPAVSVRELANGRLRVRVRGLRPFAGRRVELQRLVRPGTWKTIGRKGLSSASIAVMSPRLPTSTLRVAMSVNQAGAGYLGAASHALRYRQVALSLHPSALKVLFGRTLMLKGRVLNGRIGQHVTIYSRPYGQQAFRPLETVAATKRGRFQLIVQPTIQTTYQARLGGARESAAATVGVQPALTVLAVSHEHLKAHVAAGERLRGRMVELQKLVGGTTWRTIAKAPLGASSTASFHLALEHATIRVAISVNQAGAGYLGSFSHPLGIPAI
jgi:hypothetical protein